MRIATSRAARPPGRSSSFRSGGTGRRRAQGAPSARDVPGHRLRRPRTTPATGLGEGDCGRAAAAVTAAAVLVPIIAHPDGLTVLFTRRTVHLKAHSGQGSFPGGRAEPDDPTPEVTALREAEEEIGLARARVELLGRCSDYL